MHVLTNLAAIAGSAGLANAIAASEGSPCSSSCGNVLDTTTGDDIVCDQNEYALEDAGEVFQGCVECQLQSGYQKPEESDSQWALYNLRYAASYCLFNYPDHNRTVTTPCITSEACEDYGPALKFNNLTTDAAPYDYCALWPTTNTEHFDQCVLCLQSDSDEYMANFITTLQAGCEQQPDNGVTLGLDGDVFSDDYVTITEPTPRVTGDPSWYDQGPLDVAAKAGIVSGGVVLLLIIAGCCIIWRGKRKRRAFLRNYDAKNGGRGARSKGWPSPLQTSNMREVGDTPLSQKPLRNWDESPMSAHSEQGFPRYFSPYSSQFNSPISASEAQMPQWPVLGPQHAQHLQQLQQEQMVQQAQQRQAQQPQTGDQHIGLAIGGDTASDSSDSKGQVRVEEYEMQNVDHNDRREAPRAGEEESYFTHARQYSGSYRSFSQRMNGMT